ncbi:hypothetical protein CQ057_22815 [Ochrobactrum sp. MYb49]|nr:hypothetical protein CQ057_22815 [Ochrobactrum sp. MYb49]
MVNKRKKKQKLVYFEGVPSQIGIGPGESGVNIKLINEIKANAIFKRKKWPRILDLLVENHYEDATIADSQSVAHWADVNYNTVWRLKNFLLEQQLLILINRNGLVGFEPRLVMVKNSDGIIIEPKLQTRF